MVVLQEKQPRRKKKEGKKEKQLVFDNNYGEIDSVSGRPKNVQDALHKRIGKAKKSTILDLSQTKTNKQFRYNYHKVPSEIYNVFESCTLTQLWLTNNQLTGLTPEIQVLKQLKVLGLEGNIITALPNEIGSLRCLERLMLQDNQSRALPDTLGELSRLVELRLDRNSFTYFPMQVIEIRSLRRLGLSFNQITHLPPDIGKMTKLIELDLDYNKIGPELPNEISNLTKLRILGLECNYLSSKATLLMNMALNVVRVTGNRAAGYEVYDEKTGDLLEDVNVPIRHDGYLELYRGEKVMDENGTEVHQVKPLDGHMECSKYYNYTSANWYRNPENRARAILKTRSKRLKWKQHNRLV